MDLLAALVVLSSGAGIVGGVVSMAQRRRGREKRSAVALAHAVSRNLHIPQTLHPVIDPDICIGSLSCLKVCPEGDILGVVGGVAKLIEAANCIGHGRCALECPVGAIKLVFGSSERGIDLPEVDEFFESNRPGVHVVGELGGMGLIKNAITQGLQVAKHLEGKLRPSARPADEEGSASGSAYSPTQKTRIVDLAVDVVIVGAGPAGLATAVGCKAAGLSFQVLEQGTLGGTIAQYPRQKVVMTEPVVLPFYGKFGKRLISKEELLSEWGKVLRKGRVEIREGQKMVDLQGEDGSFVVVTEQGTIPCRKVVLATGRRGSPRKLGVPGESLPKVTYGLIDPEQYEGCSVLVVGGGDAALEAAIQIAEQSDAAVSISYRNEAFGKCREANRQKIAALIASKRVRALMGSQVSEIRPSEVLLSVGGPTTRLQNDYVIVCIGGELPLEFLKKAGVGVRRHTGTVSGQTGAAGPGKVGARRGSARQEAEDRRERRVTFALFIVGALVVASLAVIGWDYYRLSPKARLHSPLNAALRPSGPWGHGIGIVATGFMLSNFLYSVRKRWRLLKGAAPIRRWLTFHMFVGFMSPLVIAFHAAFRSNNLVATATVVSLAVVVGTGAVGRFVYNLVPTSGDKAMELAELVAGWERLKFRVEPLLTHAANPIPVRAVLERVASPVTGGSLARLFVQMPFDALRSRWSLFRVRGLFKDQAYYLEFKTALLRLMRLRTQVGFYRSLKRLLSTWRLFHAVLAVFLVFMIAAHIGVSLYLGYGWIFS